MAPNVGVPHDARMKLTRTILAGAALSLLVAGWACHSTAGGPKTRWFKGNTHTHTLWSDGDGAPELVVDWYREQGYDFLALSDHNILSRGERWFPVAEATRLTAERVAQLEAKFGPLELREREGRREMRLRTLDELRASFERAGEFLLVEAEEITDRSGKAEIHINALNLSEAIKPQGGPTAREAIERNLAAIEAEEARSGKPLLAHINHPNYKWSLTWEDIAHVAAERFFEVYNGHPAVGNDGDATHASMEELWDRGLVLRLRELGLPVFYGVASDDAHGYHRWGVGEVNPGRGWVVVRAAELTPEAIVLAMKRGDFYASSGVEIADVSHDARRYRVAIEAEAGASYTTRFVGARASGDALVLHETSSNPAEYRLRGDELYVRAVVTSSKLHPNPYRAGDFEKAWLQPFAPRGVAHVAASAAADATSAAAGR
jgi:hypothetical protein